MNIRIIKNKKSRKIKNNTKESIKKIMIFLCFVFFVGILVGSIYFKFNIEKNFIEEHFNIYNGVNVQNINLEKQDVFLDLLLKNIFILIFFWIIGLSIVGVPILLFYIFFEGFSISVSIIYIIKILGLFEGYKYIFSTMYLSSLIIVFSLIILCSSAIKVTINVLKQKRDIKAEFIRHSFVCLIGLFFLLILAINDAFLVDLYKNIFFNSY